MRIGVVVIAHDGLQSILTGVGVVVNSFVESFSDTKKKCPVLKNNESELICIAPYIDKNSKDFHKEVRVATEEKCKKNGGYLKEIATSSDGSSQQSIWGDYLQWKSASKNAAEEIKKIQKEYDKIIVISHDTIFALVSKHLSSFGHIYNVWIPHSLGKVFDDKYTNKNRIRLEADAIESINNSKNNYIGAIGNFFEKILISKYFAKPKKILPLTNGLYKKSFRFNKQQAKTRDYGIPKNKNIIFSSGRCVHQKGFDIIISASKRFLEENKNYHLVLLMPTETSDKKYVDKIKSELEKLPAGQVTPIFKFDSGLPVKILKNRFLKIAIFASRFEGNPISPLEAKLFCGKEVIFVYSNIPPHKDLFRGEKSSISFSGSHGDLYSKMIVAKDKKGFTKRITGNMTSDYSVALNQVLE